MKQCKTCGETKPKSEFYKNKSRKDGLQSQCKSCKKLIARKWAKANPQKVKASQQAYIKANPDIPRGGQYRRKYGITIADYDQMLEDQGGVCKICGTDTPGARGRFHIDHCHTTGNVRGLLCNNCNHLLGNAQDNPKTLANAIAYLTA